ncbi:metal ABC transporter substrate-binding protein [Xaviernesmea oryzae]|uniref:Metal ABC transporter substrate-binding protein n=1 Tax=Xaviernesmea oryzae TaxID=464029 RepID=A0A1Q9B3E6_9HYPH|nr:metal ABC transporter substrate-binding protein [Xaviernesmea oryzae]OLP62575.1 metal ABC transporter substrate-binding protein [Xaviernesmea oryzae]SEM18930.1 zinc/manganese transport system substrate-binding protein [Xaviernesmea oryzae]
MNTRLLRLALASAALVLPLSAAQAADGPLKVVATFSILGDFARQVGGDRVAVTTLVGPNGDTHVYEPKPTDAAAIGKADVVLVNGLGLEGFMDRLVESSGTKAEIVTATKGVKPRKMEIDEDEGHEGDAAKDGAKKEEAHEGHHHTGTDPHAWQNVANAEIYVKNIVDGFCKADKAGCDDYKKNGAAYEAQLKGLDAEVRKTFAGIPKSRKTVITTHDAFGYYAAAYGLKFLAPEGLSTESEASAKDMAALVEQVRHDKATAIFLENISDPRLMQQIGRETGLTPGPELYSDALSEANGPAATYVDMIRYNTKTIATQISGS